ncbi:MAG: nickel-dependent hydrogenase large subunit [Veillonellaceae bacterium]|nr:nickel-dependent hydrogenase large subunit [Veillonellaceae bacterium]
MAVKTIFPFTRIHAPMRLDVDIQGGKVIDAHVSGTLFRGFENMMIGRDPRDCVFFMQRICGICSSAHSVASAIALQQIFKVAMPPNGQHLANLIFAADIIQNHLRHFYVLVFFDYVKGPDIPPYVPRLNGDYRIPEKVSAELLEHMKQGVHLSARAHEMMAIFGAKTPHQQTILPSGVTEKASSERIVAYRSILSEITEWVEKVHIPDVLTIASYYKDYYNLGIGYGNFISYGMFTHPVSGKQEFQPGIIKNRGRVEQVDMAQITEDITASWYSDQVYARHPAEGTTVPDRDKAEAYSWVKAPRYDGQPFETGPLARGFICGDYQRGISAMDRVVARAYETLKICRLAASWLDQLAVNGPTILHYTPLPNGEGYGTTDAMRGALGHWLKVKNGKVVHYQVITPTTWNFSPRDSQGRRGPVEEALVGTPVADPESLIEVGRVVRSFDPCFTCAVHLLNMSDDPVRLV